MLRSLILFLCFFIYGSLSAQNEQIDSLNKKIAALESEYNKTINSDTNLISCYLSVAEEYYNLENRVKEQEYSNKALKLINKLLINQPLEKIKTFLLSEQAATFDNIGTYYSDINDYPKAFEYYFKALKIDESINNPKGIWRHLVNIAIAFGDHAEHKKSIEYNLRALSIANTYHLKESCARVYQNIGAEYNYQSERGMALTYYFKALKMYEKEKDTLGIQMVLGNLGTVYAASGEDKSDKGIPAKAIADYITAATYYKKSLELYKITNSKWDHAINLSNYGSLCTKLGKYDEAKIILDSALSLSKTLSDQYGIMETNEYLSLLYDSLGDIKKSYQYYKTFISTKDSIFNTESTKKNLQAEMNFEFEKKQALQKAEHEKAIIALEAENRVQKNTRNFIILISLMLILLGISAFVYFNNKKSLELHELFSQQLIIAQDNEKKKISKELHDSIGQNILFIKNQMIKSNNLTLMPSINETLEEVRNISKDLFPNQLEKYGLVASVEALAEKATEASNVFISCDLDDIDQKLTPENKINIYRIIQECISNTIKHANAKALRITGKTKNKEIEIVVQDDGKGFNKVTLDKKAQHSFGILNIEERVKSLKGRMDLETSPGNGTKYKITIPV